jgi:hypothetical protein
MRARHAFIIAVAGGIILFLASWVLAESPVASTQLRASYDLSWWTVDGGGGRLGAGNYSLSGTAGQPDAGAALEQGGYTLIGGYWYGPGEEEVWYELYLPLVLR